MKNKLFNRLFKFYALIMAIAFVILGLISSFLISVQISDEKANSLINSAYNVSGIYSSLSSEYSPSENILFVNMISMINEIQNVDVFVVSANGYVAYSTTSIQKNLITDIISEENFKNIMLYSEYKGDIEYKSSEDNYTKRYTVAVPIYDDNNKAEGTVIIASDDYNFFPQVILFFLIFTIAGIIILLVTYVFIYLFTKNITKPLEEMSVAAKKYAKGDFTQRIGVPNNVEMANLATTFNYMADNLDKLENMRQSFIADVSHELRTPMTSISGFIDGMLDGVIPRKDFDKYLDIVSKETKRLSRLTASLLDVAKIQSGQTVYVMNPFNIIDCVTRTVISLESKIEKKKLEVEIITNNKTSLFVMGDTDAIYRVCYNLIDNAVKFSNDKGKLIVKITEDDKNAYISILNTGIGISNEDIPYIFERFYKADKSRSKNKAGSGIGLYLVKMIISAHNGDISVKSKEGKYAEFKFSLVKAPENFS